MSLSVFSSVIGPFGGFFASGFKRAFKIKVIINFSLVCRSIHLPCFCLGLWRHHSRSRRYHGQIRLPILDGHICERIHFKLHSDSLPSETAPTGMASFIFNAMYTIQTFFLGYDHETRATVADVLLSQGGLGEQRNPVSWKLNAIQLEICYFAFQKIPLLVLYFPALISKKMICFA